MQHGIGMEFTALSHHDVVVEDHTGMQHAVGSDATAGTDADPGSDRRSSPHHSPLINHGGWVDLRQGALAWHQLIQSFRKGQPRIGEHRKGDAPLTGPIDQLLLVRQQQGPHRALLQNHAEGIALFQKAELIRPCPLEGGRTRQQGIQTRLTP